MKYKMGYDAETKTQEVLHLDGTGKGIMESIQDCEDIIQQNAYEAEFLDKKKDYWKIGSIPLSWCFAWAKESGTKPFSKEWQAFIKKKLMDSDYRKFNVNRIRF